MNGKIKEPAYVSSILNNRATEQNYYQLARSTNGKYRVLKLTEIPESWGYEYTHCWIPLTQRDTQEDAWNFMQGLP